MLKFKKQEGQEYDKTPAPRITREGEFIAEVVKLEEFQSERGEKEGWAPSVKFIFRVIEDDFFGGFASGLVTSQWHSGNKLDNWLSAMGMKNAGLNETIVPEQLKGKIVKVDINLSQKGFANVKVVRELHPNDRARISANYKPRGTKQAAPQAPVQQAPAPTPAPQPPAQQALPPQPPAQPGTVIDDDSVPF